jgi:predicted permease
MRGEKWIYTLPLRLRSLFRQQRVDRELDQELRYHVDRRTEENIAKGMAPEEARRQALLRMGGIEKCKEECRETRRVNWIQDLRQDLRYGIRMLRKSPGFTAVAVLTLALGIGANTAIFSLADALLFRPFPITEPGKTVALMRQKIDQPDYYSSFSYPDYEDIREQSKSLSGLAAFDSVTVSMTINGEVMRINGEIVSGNYFSVLGLKPSLGKAFLPEEDEAAGARPVIVVSNDFWRHRLSSDRDVIGKPVVLNGGGFTVIGVGPAGFHGLSVGSSPAFWVPLAMHDQVMPSFTFEGQSLFYARGCDWLDLVGRLEPGRTVAEAEAEARALAGREATIYPAARKGWTVVVSPLNEVRLSPWNADMMNLMGLLMAVVGVVLLIACSNVAGLLLARASVRRLEIGIRTGLGARRSRLVRQLLTESLLISALGGAGAILLASFAIRILASVQLPGIDVAALGLGVDWRVLSFTLVVAALSALLFGAMPALQTSKVDLAETSKGSRRSAGSDRARLRRTLVISQIALTFLLLVGSGLLVRTLRNLLRMNLGFDSRQVLLMSVDLGLERYTEVRARQLYQQVLERVQQVAGVHSACWASTAPLSGWHIAFDVVLEDRTLDRDRPVNVDGNWVSPGFFSMLGIPIVAGRDFSSRDREGTPRVAIVSESTARRLWPGENPLSHRFWMHARGNGPSLEVIGVAKDGKYYNTWRKDSSRPFVFLPFDQAYQPQGTLLVKGDPGMAIAATVRRELEAVDPNLPVFDIETFEQQFREQLLLERVGALLVAAFGAVALALAAVGIFGLISFSVAQRTHEIGVRMAVGAQPRDVIGLVLRQGLALTVVGTAAGLAGSLALTRFLSSLLYGVKPTDPLTLMLATLTLAAVSLVSCYVPARRATRVDPTVALRHE